MRYVQEPYQFLIRTVWFDVFRRVQDFLLFVGQSQSWVAGALISCTEGTTATTGKGSSGMVSQKYVYNQR